MLGASSARKIAIIAAVGCAAAAVFLAWRLTGFLQPQFGLNSAAVAAAVEQFSAAQRRAAAEYNSHIVWPITLSMLATTAVYVVIGFTSLGERLASWAARRFRRLSWLVIALVIAVLGAFAAFGFDVWAFVVRTEAGLSVASFPTWLTDWAMTKGITLLVVGFAVAVLAISSRFARSMWWLPAGVVAGAAVMIGAWLAPVVIEPLFTHTTPLSATRYADQAAGIRALAAKDDFNVTELLVADASSKTTTLNAYVSGLNGRIVLYDTLLEAADPDEVRMVVAHELSHAKHNDVLIGALIGSVAVAACVALLGALFPRLDAWRIPRLLAVVSIVMVLALPATNFISRSLEWRADQHAIALTGDPEGFITMQLNLAVANKSALSPPAWRYWWFFTHPTSPQRIALGNASVKTRP